MLMSAGHKVALPRLQLNEIEEMRDLMRGSQRYLLLITANCLHSFWVVQVP